MPGNVVDVMVNEGDQVAIGDTLFIIEPVALLVLAFPIHVALNTFDLYRGTSHKSARLLHFLQMRSNVKT
jgi:pyruvate carboxylase